MSRENDDLRVVRRNPGSQDGNPAEDGKMIPDGYATLDRADDGRARRGIAPDAKRSFEGFDYYRPRGR